jgi:hypothetical protein
MPFGVSFGSFSENQRTWGCNTQKHKLLLTFQALVNLMGKRAGDYASLNWNYYRTSFCRWEACGWD